MHENTDTIFTFMLSQQKSEKNAPNTRINMPRKNNSISLFLICYDYKRYYPSNRKFIQYYVKFHVKICKNYKLKLTNKNFIMFKANVEKKRFLRMRISPVQFQGRNKTQQKTNSHSARKSVAIATGVLSASTLYSWKKQPEKMQKVMQDCGGKSQYIKTFALEMAIVAGVVTITNKALNAASKLVKDKENPTAVN
jgi:hypothetical protein